MAPNSMFQFTDVDPYDMTWKQRLKLCKFYRHAVKKSYGDSMTNLQLIKLNNTNEYIIIGLGGGDTQTVIYGNISNTFTNNINDIELKPFFSSEQQYTDSAQPSPEAQLFYERMRSHVVNGLTGFSIHPDCSTILLSSLNNLKILKNDNVKPIASWFDGTILNPTLCPSNCYLTAFCSNGQLYIDYNNTKLYSTIPKKNFTYGVASFITQEELERFEGYWWNPSTTELLFEEVDETNVPELIFECPGKQVNDLMKYPLTGTINPTSKLGLIKIDIEKSTVKDYLLPYNLKELYPWYEYLVRVGWVNDIYCYCLIMNRTQTRQSLILIDKNGFDINKELMTLDEFKTKYIYNILEEKSDIWLNSNYLIYFLPTILPEIKFIFGSEKNDLCHLYLHSVKLKNDIRNDNELDISYKNEIQITSGNWTIIKEAPLSIDEKRCHVYYLTNKISPLITSLCVSSYNNIAESKILTPNDLCYRQERGQFSLNINPEIGFVAWVSSINHLPECRFYRLIQNDTNSLPDVIYQCSLKLLTPLFKSPIKETFENEYNNINLLNLFKSYTIEYKSDDSGYIHNALVFLPNIPPKNDGYPIIHHVYAGPSVQQVRNSWQNVAQFLRFLSVGYAVIVIDGRGSSNRGIKFEGAIKNNLGNIEMKDQIDGLKKCIDNVPNLDQSRIAVTGWSYGGYMALLLLSNYPRLYRAACAGGAVTDWNLYDTCYTERYMDLPKDNPIGYKNSCINKLANKFPDEEGRLLIVHGLIDENVHFHHTEQLINALIAAGKPFEQLILPTERHGIRQGSAVEFFHARQLSFFAKAFKNI